MKSYDAAILGGGLTGAALFLALAPVFIAKKRSLVIVEREAETIKDNRMLSLGYAGGSYLGEFGIKFDPYACKVSSLEVNYTGKSRFRNIQVNAKDIGRPVLGWAIRQKKLLEILWSEIEKMCREHQHLSMMRPHVVDSYDLSSSPAVLKSSTGDIEADLILVAAGAASLAKTKHISYKRYNQLDSCPQFSVTDVKLGTYYPNRGYWFFKYLSGIGNLTLALVPSGGGDDGLYTAIISLPPKFGDISKDRFIEIVNLIISPHIDAAMTGEEIMSYPGLSYLAEERVKGPLVLLGNAAHSIAPLGGQNFNLSLWTVRELRRQFIRHFMIRDKFNEDRSFLAEFVNTTETSIQTRIKLVHWLDNKLASGKIDDFAEILLQVLGYLNPAREKVFKYAAGMTY